MKAKIKILFLPLIILPLISSADEPGHLRNENIPHVTMPKDSKSEEDSPKEAPRKIDEMALLSQFKRARGLSRNEAMTLYMQRVSCARRVYSPSGWALDGDGDLKVTQVGGGNFEIEFPTFFFLGTFNPFKNGLYYVEATSPRKLVNFERWPDGQSLLIGKLVTLISNDPTVPNDTVPAVDEFRVLGDAYPPRFIVREEIHAKKKFSLYFICQ